MGILLILMALIPEQETHVNLQYVVVVNVDITLIVLTGVGENTDQQVCLADSLGCTILFSLHIYRSIFLLEKPRPP
jgi:hypothetical protein